MSRRQRRENRYFLPLVSQIKSPPQKRRRKWEDQATEIRQSHDRWEVGEEDWVGESTAYPYWIAGEIVFRHVWCHLRKKITHAIRASSHNRRWLVAENSQGGGQPCELVTKLLESYSYQTSRAHHPGGACVSAAMSRQRRAWDGLRMKDGQQKGKEEATFKKKHEDRSKHTQSKISGDYG